MFDEGNSQMSAVGFFNPMLGGGDAVSAFGGGAGGEGGLGGVFDISGGKIVRCALVFGRKWVTCSDTTLEVLGEGETPSGIIYAEVDHSSASLVLSVKHKEGSELPDTDLQKSYRALYYAYNSGGATPSWSWADVRFQPAMFAMN